MHRHVLRVYYEDTDAGGVVYHANYLGFAERARTEALRDAGAPHSELAERFGLMFMVRRIKVEYLRPARLDDELTVESETQALGAAWARIRQNVLARGQLLAELEVTLACVRTSDGRPARIPERWRRALGEEEAGEGPGSAPGQKGPEREGVGGGSDG
jgi:acyl-CoA thioester hydrolase